MLKPDWVHPRDWNDLSVILDELTMDFALSLPKPESDRLIADEQFFESIEEQLQQKLVSALETYRAKGIHAGTKAN